jgi:acyl-CoA synthetase (AMP-forming)/AMP-acid ligase II
MVHPLFWSCEYKMKQLQASAIVARNSLAYVAQVFASGEARRTLVSVQDARHANDLHGIAVDRCIEVGDVHGWYSQRHQLIADDAPAQIVFTSGTEGNPKAIVLSYANLADTAGRIIKAMGMTSEIREYVGVPVTYSFGMGRFRAISAVGGRAYLSPRGFDPLELVRMLESGEVNSLSAVPTLLRILLESPEVIGAAGKKLLWLEIGSQYMSASEKRGVRELFPNARIVQHYGLTEASRSTFLDVSGATQEALESVGRPDGTVEIGFDAQGRIRIRGPHVARWRVDAQGLHALCDAEGWLQTNDLGHMRDGYLYFDGRADDLINCGGIKIVPDVLEEKIRARLGTGNRIAVARVKDAARGEAVLVVAEATADLQRLREAATAAMGELGVAAAGSLHVREVAAIPTTATGKPRRRELSADFEAGQQVPSAVTTQAAATPRDVRSVFQRIFPGTSVSDEDTFETLGGDSLRYIQFSMQFERLFGPLPEQWQSLSVSQLQNSVKSASRSGWRTLEPATLMRAIGMIFIAARHTGAFTYSRNYGAGVLLFALGGYALSRFQLPEVLRKGSVRSVIATALLVAIPTIFVAAPTQVMTHTFDPLQFLLISNFFDPQDPRWIKGVSFYFAEIYFQLFLLAALVFSFSRVRALFREHPLASALGLLAAAAALKFLVAMVWNTDYLFNRVPQYYAWTFCLGILVGIVRTLPQRLLALAIVATGTFISWGFDTSTLLVTGGLALVLFVPSMRVPTAVKSVVGEIAAASIFIYLVHFQVRDIVRALSHGNRPWLALFASVAVGICCAYVYGYLQRLAGQTALGRRFFAFLAG